MYGAIIGDVVGSRFEFNPIKTKNFEFITKQSTFTDDTVMTVAVAKSLLDTNNPALNIDLFKKNLIKNMQEFGKKYPRMSYGMRFYGWLHSDNPQPYNSLGNGSAMRVSPCGLTANSLEEALVLAEASSDVTHNHPEGIKGAKTVAGAVFLANNNCSKDLIRRFVEDYYELESLDNIRMSYTFDETCPGSVPQAIECFLESEDYEDTIRNAVSLGGDADTQAAIAGSIAWSFYKNRDSESECRDLINEYSINRILPDEFIKIVDEFSHINNTSTLINLNMSSKSKQIHLNKIQ